MPNVDTTVHKMLHDRTNHLRHDKFFLKGNVEIRKLVSICNDIGARMEKYVQ